MTDLAKFPDAVEARWSSGFPTLATSGGIFLEGAQWGVWEGWLAVATLKDSKLCLFEFTADGAFVSQVVVPELDGDFGRLRTPMMGPDGALYVTTSNGNRSDRILRIGRDMTSPEVEDVEITSHPGPDATYAIGDSIVVSVTFDEVVLVKGTPQLILNVGGRDRPAFYNSGSNSATLVFTCPVISGDLDSDGMSIEADSLSRGGGTIRDRSDNGAVLGHQALAADANHKVDGVKPRLASTGGAVINGTTLTLTYDEPLDGSSKPAAGDFTVSGGDQTRTVTRVSRSGSTVTLTLHLTDDEGTASSIELRFGPDNRFEHLESIQSAAATRSDATSSRSESTLSRSGTYTYERTGPRMGTITLNYDDGTSCQIRLSFTQSGVGAFAYDCGDEAPGRGQLPIGDRGTVRPGDPDLDGPEQLLLHLGADADQPGGRGGRGQLHLHLQG